MVESRPFVFAWSCSRVVVFACGRIKGTGPVGLEAVRVAINELFYSRQLHTVDPVPVLGARLEKTQERKQVPNNGTGGWAAT